MKFLVIALVVGLYGSLFALIWWATRLDRELHQAIIDEIRKRKRRALLP